MTAHPPIPSAHPHIAHNVQNPDALLRVHNQKVATERSEQIKAAAHIVPEAASAGIERPQEDWLDKDAQA